jgi:pimeloyl-ACP methyl ester carboxylesterase
MTFEVAALLFNAIWAYARRGRRLLDTTIESVGVDAISRRFRLALVWLGTGTVLGALVPVLGMAVIAAFIPFYWRPIPGEIARAKREGRDRTGGISSPGTVSSSSCRGGRRTTRVVSVAGRRRMDQVTSKDGTAIAYERLGAGPAVILVGGAFVDRSENAPLAAELAERFSVYNYDRRGRGDSGDTRPYAVEREIEDLEALIAEAGGAAHLYGISSGGALVLEAAAAGVGVDRLAVYEVPYDMAEGGRRRHREYMASLERSLAEGRRGDAAELFMRLAGASDEMVAGARSSPMWPGLEAIAHTLLYDAACMGDNRPPTDRLARITRPTLVATGGASPESFVGGGGDFFAKAADAVAASIPRAQRQTVEGQTHQVDPKVMASVLERFFTGPA